MRSTKYLVFLGSTWNGSGIERLPAMDESIRQAILAINANMKKKDKARIRGLLNYYLCFAVPVHSIVNRAIQEPNIGKTYLFKLMEVKKIKFKDPPTGKPLFSDAIPYRLGFFINFCTM